MALMAAASRDVLASGASKMKHPVSGFRGLGFGFRVLGFKVQGFIGFRMKHPYLQ